MKKDEPAFPHTPGTDSPINHPGMSIRDFFAAKALQGEIASPSLIWNDDVFDATAANAYRFADAMLKARAT